MSAPPFVATSINDLHERCAQGIGQLVLQYADSEIGSNVSVGMITLIDTLALPGVMVTFENVLEQQDMDFEGNIDGYPLQVLLCDRADLHDQTNRKKYLAWRKTLMDACRAATSLATAPEVWNIEVTPTIIFDPQLPAYQHLVTGFTVKCMCWDPRPKL